jgi:hypothetical protein
MPYNQGFIFKVLQLLHIKKKKKVETWHLLLTLNYQKDQDQY